MFISISYSNCCQYGEYTIVDSSIEHPIIYRPGSIANSGYFEVIILQYHVRNLNTVHAIKRYIRGLHDVYYNETYIRHRINSSLEAAARHFSGTTQNFNIEQYRKCLLRYLDTLIKIGKIRR